jgi:hypothetical protein
MDGWMDGWVDGWMDGWMAMFCEDGSKIYLFKIGCKHFLIDSINDILHHGKKYVKICEKMPIDGN